MIYKYTLVHAIKYLDIVCIANIRSGLKLWISYNSFKIAGVIMGTGSVSSVRCTYLSLKIEKNG